MATGTELYQIYDPRQGSEYRFAVTWRKSVSSLDLKMLVVNSQEPKLVEKSSVLLPFFQQFGSEYLLLQVDSMGKRTREVMRFMDAPSEAEWGYFTIVENTERDLKRVFDCMESVAIYNGESWVIATFKGDRRLSVEGLQKIHFADVDDMVRNMEHFDILLFRNFDYQEWTLFVRSSERFDEAIEFFESRQKNLK